MKATPSRQSPAEWEETALLLPQTARELPTGRHQFHKERLMAHIEQDIQQNNHTATATAPQARPKTGRFRLLRPAITLPALACALAGAVVATSVMNDGDGVRQGGVATGPALTTQLGTPTTKGVPQLLDQISLAAAETGNSAVKPGQYVYIESKMAETYIRHDGDKVSLASHALHKRQIWDSADGTKGWLIDPAVNHDPAGETLSLPDELGNTPKATLNAPSYDFLAKLPTDPDKLLAMIYKASEGHGNSLDQQAFITIGDLLGESYPPAELYSALFKAAKKIPGVVVVPDAKDALGRPGVAVARLDETGGSREEWIFDKKTHVFLGEREVQVKETTEDGGLLKPGTVKFTSAIVKRAIVDGMKQLPTQNG
ncbi:CU044_5270 family protein [Streptomyces olivochromogenes]|uniref:CU044_5270 family protein n=1 Tax=Streptomyces olivochromogenes TaxID=1963 RepID=UPI001F41F74B|nr:CU044_5270 family protein [Streptomyces olivochromogenes]MCF3137216.1 CU044_5270 family protein [Streptomyces olivochromogenes]